MKIRTLAFSALVLGVAGSAPWLLRRTERPAVQASGVPLFGGPAPERFAVTETPARVVPVQASRGVIEDALRRLATEPDPHRAETQMEALIASFATADLSAVFAELSAGPTDPGHTSVRLRLLRRWAGHDPQAAAAALRQTPLDAEARGTAVHGVALEWAARDLPGALAWVRQLPEVRERQEALVTVAYEVARNTPQEALSIASELAATPDRDDLITHAAAQWAATAPALAVDWARQIADPAERERVLAAIATAWADRDPVAAGTLAVGSLAPGRAQEDAVISIIQRWVQRQPAEAAAWVNGFPEGSLRNSATLILDSARESSGAKL